MYFKGQGNLTIMKIETIANWRQIGNYWRIAAFTGDKIFCPRNQLTLWTSNDFFFSGASKTNNVILNSWDFHLWGRQCTRLYKQDNYFIKRQRIKIEVISLTFIIVIINTCCLKTPLLLAKNWSSFSFFCKVSSSFSWSTASSLFIS